MPPGAEPGGGFEPPSILIPEVRDYQRINSELATLLDFGHTRVILQGAEGQRLLVSGLSGSWRAVVEVRGRTGPEFASNIDAPNLLIVGRGSTADGAGGHLGAGSVIVLGDAGEAVGYCQSGGLLVVLGSVGNRAGLAQSGGTLAVLGRTGRLAADRQSGGTFLVQGEVGPYPGRGQQGGRLVEAYSTDSPDSPDLELWREVLALSTRWAGDSTLT